MSKTMKELNKEFHNFITSRTGRKKVDKDDAGFFFRLFTDIGIEGEIRKKLVKRMNTTGLKKAKLNGINIELTK